MLLRKSEEFSNKNTNFSNLNKKIQDYFENHYFENELEKIKSFSLNKKKLEVDEIKSIINFSGEYKSDSFINECLCGNIPQYKKILSELYINFINLNLPLKLKKFLPKNLANFFFHYSFLLHRY